MWLKYKNQIRKIVFLFTFLVFAFINHAQTSITISDLQPGLLKTKLSAEEIKTVNELKLEGSMDARDFRFIRDSIKNIAILDLLKIKIAGYSGNEGTGSNWYNTYSPNELPKSAFKNCSSLKSIILPDSLLTIGIFAFDNCYNLNSIALNPCLKEIGAGAFEVCHSLSIIKISENVVSIGAGAFYGCSELKEVELPSSLVIIADGVFAGCEKLGKISIPPSVTEIGVNSFAGCISLKQVSISDSVKYIGNNAFMGSGALINVSAGNPLYMNTEGVLFNKNQTLLIYCAPSKSGNYTIPSTVKTIKGNAFYYCKDLTSVTIPSTTDTIGAGAFSGCLTLYQIKIPKTVRYIGYGAFELCGFSSITLPDSIKSINESTFWGCQGLKSIVIPDAVLHIGSGAFYNCLTLKSVLFQNSHDTIISNDAFSYCTSLQSFTIPNTVKSIGNAAFYNCRSLSSVTIPASVSAIGDMAFASCLNLKTIYAYPEIPVTLPSEKVFNRVDKDSCRLFIPNQSLDLYKSAQIWKDFFRVESIVTLVKRIENPGELIIYPNPATDILNINANEGLVLIYDSKGRLTLSHSLKNSNSINISSLTPGFYVVNVNGARYKVLKK